MTAKIKREIEGLHTQGYRRVKLEVSIKIIGT